MSRKRSKFPVHKLKPFVDFSGKEWKLYEKSLWWSLSKSKTTMNLHEIFTNPKIWVFPKIGVPPKSSI